MSQGQNNNQSKTNLNLGAKENIPTFLQNKMNQNPSQNPNNGSTNESSIIEF